MSHEIESPAPKASHARGDADGRPSAGTLTRQPTLSGVGIGLAALGGAGGAATGDVPSAPLTEVVPAPEVRREGESGEPSPPRAGVGHGLGAPQVPIAQPSETIIGTRAPLHTAAEANTQVDASTLSADDADRIIAAAEADQRLQARRPLSARSPSSVLPPPPPLRRSSFPPPPLALQQGALKDLPPLSLRPLSRPPIAPPSSQRPRSSYPPPPARRTTLLLPTGPAATGPASSPAPSSAPSSANAAQSPPGSIRSMLARHAASDTQNAPIPSPASVRPSAPASVRSPARPSVPPSVRPAPSVRPPASVRSPARASVPPPVPALVPPPASVRPPAPNHAPASPVPEALSSGLLLDDSGELAAAPRASAPQPVSSSSLVEDPDSSPDLDFEEEPPPLAPVPRAQAVRFPAAAAFAPTAPFPQRVSFTAPVAQPVVETGAAYAPTAPFPQPAQPASFAAPFAQPVAETGAAYAPTAPFAQPDPFGAAHASVPPQVPAVAVPAANVAYGDPVFHHVNASRSGALPAFEIPPSSPGDDSPPAETMRQPRFVQQPAVAPAEHPRWLMPALAFAAAATLAVGVGVVAYAAKWVHEAVVERQNASVPPASSAAGSPSPSSSPSGAPSDSPAAEKTPAVSATLHESSGLGGAACVLAGAPHIVAPRALLRTGIETSSFSDRIALGVGVGDREGFVVALDPATFAVVDSSRHHAPASLRRVVPVFASAKPGDKLTAFLETTHRRTVIDAARVVPADPSFVVGTSGDAIVWAASPTAATVPLWTLASEAPVDAIRVVALPEQAGYAVAFRQGASLFLGALHADKTINGELVRIAGQGPQIGAPTLAAGSDHVAVAWADRATPAESWAIRWLSWRPGSEPGAPIAFPIPAGGAGDQAMSPSLASLAGGRFVIAWTEGGGARHEVRAEALDSAGKAVGTALTVSSDGINAGEGTPALTADGRGAIVFLASPIGATASVVAVPIICPGS